MNSYYAKIARKYPKQVAAIFIRNVTTARPDDARFQAVQEGLGDVHFMLFDEPDALRPVIERFFASQK